LRDISDVEAVAADEFRRTVAVEGDAVFCLDGLGLFWRGDRCHLVVVRLEAAGTGDLQYQGRGVARVPETVREAARLDDVAACGRFSWMLVVPPSRSAETRCRSPGTPVSSARMTVAESVMTLSLTRDSY
jgi:hypothetical protein